MRRLLAILRALPVCLALALGAWLPQASAEEAAGFLEFESVADGRCQILSSGGKLRVLHNRHEHRPIQYRLQRTFAGDHPQGLSSGVAPAGGEAVKLGCTEVDGRPQDWIVQRAEFSP